jgi:DNA-binding beta-propeller fold protein YncE
LVAGDKLSKSIRVGSEPWQIATTPDGKMAYVTNLASGTVTPIRVATGTADKAIKGHPDGQGRH